MTLYELDELKKQLADGTLNLCACLGAINGQPHCPCTMARLAKEEAEKCNIYEHDPFEADLINRPISKRLTTQLRGANLTNINRT